VWLGIISLICKDVKRLKTLEKITREFKNQEEFKIDLRDFNKEVIKNNKVY
jgi:hypothetical protein